MPKLAAFPKLYMQQLCKDGTMSISQWIDAASELPIDGLEWYAGFLEMQERSNWEPLRRKVDEQGLAIPMMCCSPDFTHPDPEFRAEQIELEKFWIDMTAALGGKFCRVLSGQRRPELSREEGIQFVPADVDERAGKSYFDWREAESVYTFEKDGKDGKDLSIKVRDEENGHLERNKCRLRSHFAHIVSTIHLHSSSPCSSDSLRRTPRRRCTTTALRIWTASEPCTPERHLTSLAIGTPGE